MKNNNKLHTILLIIAILFMAISFLCMYNRTPSEIIKTDTLYQTKTDTLWRDTTIVEKQFVPKEVIKKKVDTLYLKDGRDTLLLTEAKRYGRRLISDKDTADLTVYVSGINAELDSLKMRLRTHTEVVTNTVEITKYIQKKRKFLDRFKIVPNVSAGYGIINKKPDIYVGVGVGFEL